MNFRNKIIFGLATVLSVILIIILIIVWRGQKQTKTAAEEKTGVSAVGSLSPAGPGEEIKKIVTPAEVKAVSREQLIKNRVKNFVERFGSYSPEADFSNFKEIEPMATAAVAAWLKTYPEDLAKKAPVGFEGVTTRVLTQKIISADALNATVIASAQREETVSGAASVGYKDILVKLVWQGDQWLVDGVYWQN
ncbi:MAG: hypothetical protein HY982_02275 [Candidatus Magasanikbacteria bacterium]|nr:hypothetical protein [Candidatus Magasanikbacteria bacterium]